MEQPETPKSRALGILILNDLTSYEAYGNLPRPDLDNVGAVNHYNAKFGNKVMERVAKKTGGDTAGLTIKDMIQSCLHSKQSIAQFQRMALRLARGEEDQMLYDLGD